MSKTLKDYLLEGGVKGKRFIDLHYIPNPEVYQVEDIKSIENGEKDYHIIIEGFLLGTGESYTKLLNLCLNDKEAEETELQTID